jgi:hypothetical protein
MYYDPETNIPFYIGKGCGSRYRDVGSRSYNKPLHNKIQKLRNKQGHKVIEFTKFLYENLSNEEALKYEIFLIEKIGRKDLNKGPLLNLTEGGDGVANPPDKISKIIEDRENFEKRIKEGKTLKQMAKIYNCGTATISKAAKAMNVKFLGLKKHLPEIDVINQYKKEKSIINLSKNFNCDREVIVRILKENDIPIEDGRINSAFRGGKGHSKLKNQTNEIIEWYKQNKSVSFMAKQLDVSNASIINILKTNNLVPFSKTFKREKTRPHASEIINLYENFTSTKTLAAKFNTTVFIIQQILKENGIKLRSKKPTSNK